MGTKFMREYFTGRFGLKPEEFTLEDEATPQEGATVAGADKGFKNNPGKDWCAGLLDLSVKQLEATPPKLAAASVRVLVRGGFEAWAEQPSGNFPLAVLKREDVAKIGGKGQVAVISAQTEKTSPGTDGGE